MNLMDLVARLKMDVSAFISGSQAAKSEAQSLKQSINEAGTGFKYTAEEIQGINAGLMDFAGKAAGVGAALTAGVTLPIAELAIESLKLASSFQQAEIGFTTLMGSATQAQQFMRELKDFAASTPFEFPDLQRAAGKLQAMGFEAKAVIPIMEAVGNAAAMLGTGEAGISRITLALGQMSNSAKVTAQDMNQLVQANIGAWQYLAEAVGKSVSETKDMVKNGLISGTEGVIAILEGMNAKFAGGMAGQMQTLTGQWSNLKDQVSFILADIGKAITPFAQTVINAAAPVLEFIKSLTEGFRGLPDGIQGSIVGLAGLAVAVGPALVAFAAFTATVSTLGSMLGVAGLGGILSMLAPVMVPLAAAIMAAGLAWEAWNLEPVREAVTGVWQTLEGFWNSTLKPVIDTVEAVGLAFVNFAGSLIGSGLQSAWEMLQSVGSTLMEAVTALASALAPLWDAFTNVLDSLSPLLQPVEDLLGFLGRMVVALVEAGLIVAWESLKAVLGLVGEAVSALANLIGNSLITLLGGLANMVREVSSIWDALFKPAIQGAIQAVRDFLGALASIPGVKQAIEATGTMFDDLKGKVTGAVNEARETVKGWGEDTKSSMQKSKEALDSAQKAYADLTAKAKEGKATDEEIKRVTEDLTRAKSNYRAELERVKPRQEELTRAVKDARTEYDAAEVNLRKTQKAFEDGGVKASELASAQTRVNEASVALKTSQSALNDITKQTGISVKEYGGGIDAVRASLQSNNTHTQTAKELHAALKDEVDNAKQAFVRAFEAYRNGTADVAAVQAAYENLQAVQDRQHPEKAAEAFVKARQQEKAESEKNILWYETTYLPRYTQMIEQIIAQELKMQGNFEKAHEAMKAKTLEQIDIKKTVSERILDMDDYDRTQSILNAREMAAEVAKAYKDLGITSTATIEAHAEKAKKAYETIRDSGKASANDILQAERVALKAQIDAQIAAGEEITKEQRKRLKDIEDELGASTKRQKGAWEDFAKQVAGIGKNLNDDLSHAFIDLFEGKGWASFKEAGVKALEEIGAAVIKVGIEYIEGILIKKIKSLYEEGVLDGLVEAFGKAWDSIKGGFKALADAIWDGLSAIGGWISNTLGLGSSAAGAAGSAAGTAGGAAGSAGGAAGSVAGAASSGIAGIVTAVASVATAISSVIGNFQMAKQETTLNAIEESTRYAKSYLRDNLVPDAQRYWPKLEGLEQFSYNVMAPVLSDINEGVIGKGDKVHSALVVDVKNELIDIKNAFHDVLFALLDVVSAFDTANMLLSTISGSLDEIKFTLGSIDRASLQSASADQQAASVAVTEQSMLTTIGNNILSLGPTFTNALANLDVRGSLQTALSGVGSQVSTALANVDMRSTLQGGFNALSGQLSNLSGAISGMRVQTPTANTNVYLTVSGSTTQSSTASLAATLRTYGIYI